MVREMADLGFSQIELSHGIRITLVPGILKALEEGVVSVSSCHNFCPLPAGVLFPAPNLFQPSSPDQREQDQWVRSTKRSIDFAHQVGATVLVCHMGSIEYLWLNPTRKLRRHMRNSPARDYVEDAKFQKLRESVLGKLRRKAPKFVQNVRDNVMKVLDHAQQKGIRLGIENREKADELPLDGDMADFLASFPQGSPLGYWHDAGHARIKERQGFLKQKEHLDRNASRLIGFHLHDVSSGGEDHQEIGSGQIDFRLLRSYWKPEHKLVVELSPKLTPEEVITSKCRLEALCLKPAS